VKRRAEKQKTAANQKDQPSFRSAASNAAKVCTDYPHPRFVGSLFNSADFPERFVVGMNRSASGQ